MNLFRIYLIVFLADVVLGIFLPIFPLYALSIGASVFLISLLVSATGFSNVIGQLYLGNISDKIGRKPIMIMGALFFILSSFIFTIIKIPYLLILPSLLHGFGIILFVVAAAYVADVSKSNELDKNMGKLMASQGVGFSIGPIIGGYVSDFWGFIPAYYLCSIFSFFALLLILGLQESGNVSVSTEHEKLLSKAIRILRRKSVLSLSIMGILVMFAFRGIQIFVPILGSELNMSLSLIGLILGARTVGSTAARIPAGYLSQYSGRKNLLFLSLLFIISSYFLLSFFSSLEFILLSVCLEGIGFGIFFTITQSFLMSISKKSERATTFALFSLVGWPLQTGLLMVLGFVGELVELSVIFLIGAIVTSLLGIASSYLLYRSDDD